MMRHKYLLCIYGIDYASNFIWALKSNSLVLATPSNWDIVISVGLEKWKHFIPIKSDGSDLEKKLKWCRENDDLCRQIAERATNYLKYYNEETENRIE